MNGCFSLNSTVFADVRVQDIHGRPGLGFHQLAVQVVVAFHPQAENDAVAITELSGELRLLQGGQPGPLIGEMRALGSDLPMQSNTYAQERWISLGKELDGARIEAIEAVRLGRDMRIRLSLAGRARQLSGAHEATIRADLDLDVNQSAWIRVLDGMGYRKTLLLEIPMPAADAPEQLRQAIEHLQQAQDLMMHGRHREAVGACRDVLDQMDAALNDEQDIPDAVKGWLNHTREMDKAARIRLVRRALKSLTHPARHADEVSARVEWGSS